MDKYSKNQLPVHPHFHNVFNTENASKNSHLANSNLKSLLLTIPSLSRSRLSLNASFTLWPLQNVHQRLWASHSQDRSALSPHCAYSVGGVTAAPLYGHWGMFRSQLRWRAIRPWSVPAMHRGRALGRNLAKVNTRRASRGAPPPTSTHSPPTLQSPSAEEQSWHWYCAHTEKHRLTLKGMCGSARPIPLVKTTGTVCAYVGIDTYCTACVWAHTQTLVQWNHIPRCLWMH